jgi:hypothetical protein
MDRRRTLQWMVAASATWPLRHAGARRGDEAAAAVPPSLATPPPAEQPPQDAPLPTAKGYGTDPDLVRIHHPGALWPLTLTPSQRRTAGALCDVILPGDDRSPSASAVGVVDFMDEWLSAPYPRHQQDRAMVLAGLGWLDAESEQRFGKAFADLSSLEQQAICDDICYAPAAKAAFATAAAFFARYRDLTAGGFYSTPEGRRDLGYIGNVPLTSFTGPPADLLRSLGLSP